MENREKWPCHKCGELVEEQFGVCWNCGADREGVVNEAMEDTAEDEGDIVICPGCMTRNTPTSHFCVKCGAPRTSYAEIAPFERIFAMGHTYRQAARRPGRLTVLIGMWLIFGPQVILMSIIFICDYKEWVSEHVNVWSSLARLLMVGLTVVYIALLYKVTRNYFRGKAMAIPMVNDDSNDAD